MKRNNVIEMFKNNYNMRIEWHNHGYVVNDVFFIYPQDNFEEKKSFGKTNTVTFVEWVVDGVKSIPATLWEPEDFHEFEISRERSFAKALARVLLTELEDSIETDVEQLVIEKD